LTETAKLPVSWTATDVDISSVKKPNKDGSEQNAVMDYPNESHDSHMNLFDQGPRYGRPRYGRQENIPVKQMPHDIPTRRIKQTAQTPERPQELVEVGSQLRKGAPRISVPPDSSVSGGFRYINFMEEDTKPSSSQADSVTDKGPTATGNVS
jgi:hypothetical protein